MDVSVVIPTRDRPELLALTLRSALWQEAVDLEVLVVDDGATGGTAGVIRQVQDTRVRLLRNAGPPGVSGARNSGIRAATGAWVAFLDDDDLWAPCKLTLQLAAAAASGAVWAYGGEVTVDRLLRVRDGAPPASPTAVVANLRRHNAVPAGASNVIVRRNVLDTVGGFDAALQTSEDWDLWLRLAEVGAPACVSRPLVALRTHGGMASRRTAQMLADVEIVAARHGLEVDRARHHRWAAWMALEDGRRSAAMGHYARAVAAGDLASLGRAAVAAVYPAVARRQSVRQDAWSHEAEAWLSALRERHVPQCATAGDDAVPAS
jgi:glycosyltransferase involved in cell wall biosynthesis